MNQTFRSLGANISTLNYKVIQMSSLGDKDTPPQHKLILMLKYTQKKVN